jgi:hypothetical protein
LASSALNGQCLGVDKAGGHIEFVANDNEGNSPHAMFLTPCRVTPFGRLLAPCSEDYDQPLLDLSTMPAAMCSPGGVFFRFRGEPVVSFADIFIERPR